MQISYVNFYRKNDINYLIIYLATSTIKHYCLNLNKIAFTLELDLINYIDKQSIMNGFNIILKIINNIDDLIINKEEPKYNSCVELQTYKSGLFLPIKECGDIISCNEIIGY